MPQSPPRVRLAEVSPPIALGPLDGRYRAATAALVEDLSEAGLNRARIEVEIAWFIHLAQRQALPGLPTLTEESVEYLRAIPAAFGPDEIAELGEIERQTVHDVKAVEYFIRRRLESASAPAQLRQASLAELVHFGATSEDINNLAYALTVRRAVGQVWLPAARELVADLAQLAQSNADVAMLSRTHGQPATPTTLGKEMGVIAHRLDRQLRRIMAGEYLGKMSGAT
ncbi:MAG: adenylosuccinate lyase, partial [Bifidobacteriaceae bacterium]|nr:adenylosuccinate lyase [Bifidobacteriaceae bacterium]